MLDSCQRVRKYLFHFTFAVTDYRCTFLAIIVLYFALKDALLQCTFNWLFQACSRSTDIFFYISHSVAVVFILEQQSNSKLTLGFTQL